MVLFVLIELWLGSREHPPSPTSHANRGKLHFAFPYLHEAEANPSNLDLRLSFASPSYHSRRMTLLHMCNKQARLLSRPGGPLTVKCS